jgi:hypothetical protein
MALVPYVMFKMLVDTCVWLDLAKDRSQLALLDVIDEMIRLDMLMRATGNTFAVMKQMGHASLRSMEPYQHQEIDQLLDAVNQRNTDRTPSQIAAA